MIVNGVTVVLMSLAPGASTTGEAVTYCGSPFHESDCVDGYKGEHCPYSQVRRPEIGVYPAQCNLKKAEEVRVEWTVGRDGRVSDASVLKSTNACVNDAALNNVRGRRYCAIHPNDPFSITRKYETTVTFLPEEESKK